MESKNITESYKNLGNLIRAHMPIKEDATDTQTVSLLKEVLCEYYPASRCICYRYCCDCIYDAIKEKVRRNQRKGR